MVNAQELIIDFGNLAVQRAAETRMAVMEKVIDEGIKSEMMNTPISDFADLEKLSGTIQSKVRTTLANNTVQDPFLQPLVENYISKSTDTAIRNRLDFYAKKPLETTRLLLNNANNETSKLIISGAIDFETGLQRTLEGLRNPVIEKYATPEARAVIKQSLVEDLTNIAIQNAFDPQTKQVILQAAKPHIGPEAYQKTQTALLKAPETPTEQTDAYLDHLEHQRIYRKIIAGKELSQKENKSIGLATISNIIEDVRSQTPAYLRDSANSKLDEIKKILAQESKLPENPESSYDITKAATILLSETSLSERTYNALREKITEHEVLSSRANWLSAQMAKDSAETMVSQSLATPPYIDFSNNESIETGINRLSDIFTESKRYEGGTTFFDKRNLDILNDAFTGSNLSQRSIMVARLQELIPPDALPAAISQLTRKNALMATDLELRTIAPYLETTRLLSVIDKSPGIPRDYADAIAGVYSERPEIGEAIVSMYNTGSAELVKAINQLMGESNLYMGQKIPTSPYGFLGLKKSVTIKQAINGFNMRELQESVAGAVDLFYEGAPLPEEYIKHVIPENAGGGGYYIKVGLSGFAEGYITDANDNRVVVYYDRLLENQKANETRKLRGQ